MVPIRHSWWLPLFVVVAQIHLLLVTSLLAPLHLLLLGSVAVLFVGSAIAHLVARLRRRFEGESAALKLSAFVLAAAIVGSSLAAAQYQQNERRGTLVARAIESYRFTHGHWPSTIESVGRDLPTWRLGLLSYDFIFWVDGSDQPNLKFVSGWFTGTFYSFERRRWYDSTM